MCGIAGIISKKTMNISESLIYMLEFIQHRGPDAAGLAVFEKTDKIILRATVKNENDIKLLRDAIHKYGEILEETSVRNIADKLCYEFAVDMPADHVQELHLKINGMEGSAVHSIGDNLQIYKEGGSIKNLTDRYSFAESSARHGIAHVRMATESAEDVNAAHPFASPFYPELAIVHNGQFTNYFNMRRFLESKGAKFKTLNDSEAASHMIAYGMMENNGDLKAALEYAKEQMDGIFCIIAATPDQLGFVKDKLGIKPLLVAQTNDYIMLGSEQIEFNALDNNVFAEEMEPGEVRVWDI